MTTKERYRVPRDFKLSMLEDTFPLDMNGCVISASRSQNKAEYMGCRGIQCKHCICDARNVRKIDTIDASQLTQ